MSKVRKDPLSELNEAVTGMPQIFPVNAHFTSAMIRFGQSYGAGLSLLSQEILDFSSKRMSKNVATIQSMCNCKEWGEVGRTQQDWISAAMQDYGTEMGKLLNLAFKTTAEACRPLQEQAEPAMDAANTEK